MSNSTNAIRDISNSQEIDGHPDQYCVACLWTTRQIMLGGVAGVLGREEFKRRYNIGASRGWNQLFRSFFATDRGVNQADWIPGDWGCVVNNGPNPNEGEEGENIIYLGGNRWYAHWDADFALKRVPISAVVLAVDFWDGKIDGSSEIANHRDRPREGLRN